MSGNPVTFTSLTPGVCSATTFGYFATAGICTVAANQAGNANYNAAPQVTQDIVINKQNQIITFGANPGPITLPPLFTFSVSAASTYTGNTTGPIVFNSITTGVCTVIGNMVTTVGRGICTITADIGGNGNTNPAPQVTQNIIFNGFPTAIGFSAAPIVVVGGTGLITAEVALAYLPVTFTSLTPAVCTIAGRIVTGVTVGTCTIAGNAAGNIYYEPPPQATLSFNIVPVVTLSTVVSRKQHFGSNRDIVIDHTLLIGDNISTEPRAIGAGHQIVFQFSGPINQPGFPGAVDSGLFDTGSTSAVVNPLANNEVIVSLTGIPDNKRVKVTLTNVNNIAVPFAASIGFMLGDVNGTRNINSSDISAVKARSGQSPLSRNRQ